MVLAYVVLLVVGYAAAASWAVSGGGRRRLWATATAMLVVIVLAAILLGWYYAVPSLRSMLLYAVAFTGPIAVVPTVLLSLAKPSARARPFPVALVGACLGLGCGWALAVFGLRVW
jgi:hypothetical protein